MKRVNILTLACLAVITATSLFTLAYGQSNTNATRFDELLATSMVEPTGVPAERLHMDCEALIFLNSSSAVRHTLQPTQNLKLLDCLEDKPTLLAALGQ